MSIRLGIAVSIMAILASVQPTKSLEFGRWKGGFAEGGNHMAHRAAERDSELDGIIRQAIEAGAITAEQGQSDAVREMFHREGFVIEGNIVPPPGQYRDDYSTLTCDGDDRRGLWLFFHWMAHIWQDQNKARTGFQLGKAIEEHDEFGDRVYDCEQPPNQPFLSYRYEQQAAILTDYALMGRCGDPNGWLPHYEKTVQPVLG